MTPTPIQMAASQLPASTPSSTTANGSNQLTGNDFMTLLVAQLKNQDPTNPMDPTQFVSQLTQFNSLEQLIGIKQDLDTSTASTTPAAGTAPNPTQAHQL